MNGMLKALNRFILKSTQQELPFYKLLRKQEEFDWNVECSFVFDSLKRIVDTLPVLTRLSLGEMLYLYLAVYE